MSNQSDASPEQAETGQKVSAQQLTPPLITEVRTASRSIFDGGILETPSVDVIGTADPGVNVKVYRKDAGLMLTGVAGADGIWTFGREILQRGHHVLTAIAHTNDPSVDPVQSPPFSINVAIGDRVQIRGFLVILPSRGLVPCGSIILIGPPAAERLSLVIVGEAGARVQIANSVQSADTPAPDSPLWGREHTIPYDNLVVEVTPIGLLPISNWFHVRTVDEGPPVIAKCLANFVRAG
jgi:hypothetical protein